MKIRVKFKKDRFSKRRGGTSKALDIFCKKCSNLVLIYQKDGPGPLLRCYVDRILYPKNSIPKNIKYVKQMPKLTCDDCGALIGTPMRYRRHGENRLAFNMVKASFKKRISTQVKLVK
jgi:DNA-directed RNA polymerase subunit M/transcription elongation factor TFIIS